MPYDFGDILLVPYVFTNQVGFKQRPAVVISNLAYNTARPDVVIMAITSQLLSPSSRDGVLIHEWQSANLLKPSAVKLVFTTLEQKLVIRSLGVLHSSDQAALRQAIASALG